MIPYLPLKKINGQHLEEIKTAIATVLESGWYLKGEATERFEKDYAAYIGTQYCIGCGNGLDALTLIFRAYKELGVMCDNDEVIVPANTFIASILSISENRLKPTLVEPRIDTLEIDDSKIEEAITPRTKAILLVHLYGRCAYTEKIGELCKKYHLKLIEDNAQAHGCRYNIQPSMFGPQRTGSLGHAAAHSFYPGKNLGALGDAGAVTTNDKRLAAMVRSLGNYGSGKKYVFNHKGINSRIDELQAAILDIKLKYLDEDNARRKAIAERYISEIYNPNITIPGADKHKEPKAIYGIGDNVWHIFPILCPDRSELQKYMLDNGVHTAIHYPVPPHKQIAYSEWGTRHLPITETIHRQELSLPCNQTMSDEETEEVIRLVNSF